MPNRRELIRMTDDEVWAFVETRKSLQVGTIERDGSVHLSTLWFAVVDGRIVFETFTRSQKVRNLQRDPRITLLLEDGEVYEELRGVMMKGVAHLTDDFDEVRRYAVAVMRRNQPEVPEDQLDEAARVLAVKRTAVVVEPTKIVSWDHRKLGGRY